MPFREMNDRLMNTTDVLSHEHDCMITHKR